MSYAISKLQSALVITDGDLKSDRQQLANLRKRIEHFERTIADGEQHRQELADALTILEAGSPVRL